MKKVLLTLVAILSLTFGSTSCSETSSDVIISVTNGANGLFEVYLSTQGVKDYTDAISKQVSGGEVSNGYIILRAQSSSKKAINAAKAGAEAVKKQYLANGVSYNGKTYQVEEVSEVTEGCFSVSVSYTGFDDQKTIVRHCYKVK